MLLPTSLHNRKASTSALVTPNSFTPPKKRAIQPRPGSAAFYACSVVMRGLP